MFRSRGAPLTAITIALLSLSLAASAACATELEQGRLRLEKMHEMLTRSTDIEYKTKVRQADHTAGRALAFEAHVRARKPNFFNVEVTAPKGAFLLVSDGKNISVVNRRTKQYAQFLSRPSLLWSMNMATNMMAFDARLLDFMWSAKYVEREGGFRVLKSLPPATISGKTCDGFVVQRDDYQWEVWLDQKTELPCRLVSIRRDGSALLIQTNDLEWVTAPRFKDDLFTFTPPPGGKLVETFELR